MSTLPGVPQPVGRSRGRTYLWAGVAACLLGLALPVAQFSLKQLFVAWYAPALATLGAALLLVAVARRRTVPRVAAVAGAEWLFFGSLMRLPDYAGPAQAARASVT